VSDDGRSSRAGADVVLRPLTSQDVPALTRLEQEPFGAGAWSSAMLAEEIHGPGRWYVGAVDPHGEQALVGYAGLWSDGTDATVMTIGVARAHQGRGVGTRLLAALLDRARQDRAASVLLEVRVDNEPALALYERFGFTRMGRRRGYYQPENVDAWTMRLDLTAAGAAREQP
jgi:[ribosomal protein S18]-alanine N-acetyltransferase